MGLGDIIGGAVGVVSNIVGGIAGREAGRGDAGEARNAMNIAFEELQKIGVPPDLSKKIIYEQFKQVGLLTPELEHEIIAGPSKVAEIQEDPGLRDTQLEALEILKQRGEGGLSPEDRAALNKVRNEIARDTEAKRLQILQNFNARGMGGSGAELISALQASQSGANEASEQGDRIAAMSSANAIEALQRAGSLGGDIRARDFDIANTKASAQDAIERFNVQNRIGTQQRNVSAGNIARERNLGEAQRVSDANIGMENAERLRQSEATRQKWLDDVKRAEIRSGARMGQAQNLQASSEAASKQAAAPWQMIGAAAPVISSFVGKDRLKPKTTNEYDKVFEAAHGGEVPGYDEGGEVEKKDAYENYAHIAKPRTLPSEEEQRIKQEALRKAFNFNQGGAIDYRSGGEVPGTAPVPGDHPANDIVPAMLSPGELVIPRSMAKTNFGKKLAKLLEDHHEIRKELEKEKK